MEREIKKIVNKIVSEEFSGRISKVKKQLLENEGETCECGGMMYEGECMECGNMYEGDIQELGGMDDGHPRFGKKRFKDRMSIEDIEKLLRGDDEEEEHHMMGHHGDEYEEEESEWEEIGEEECTECGDTYESELEEKLYGNQSKIDKNKNGRIDREDFKMLRKESKVYFTESEMIDIIENIVKEEKKKSKAPSAQNILKSTLNVSKKENDDYIKSVTKKMKEYLKDASKGEYEMEPKDFPRGNGEIEKMEKMAYIPSKAVEDFTKNLTAASLENIDYDGINPDEEWVTDNIEGSSRTGNNPDWANAVETGVNKERNQIRKDNMLSKLKKQAYNKASQPVYNDTTGNKTNDADKLMVKLESTENKKVISDMEKMKNLIGYSRKTQ